MPSITRLEIARIISRKVGDLGSGLQVSNQTGDQTEGDYTDAINSALRICQFDDIGDVDTYPKITAILTAVEYYIVEGLLYHWTSKPTTQQGAGASGLHLMVQTESTVASLRMTVKSLRSNMIEALGAIGVHVNRVGIASAGVVRLDHENELTAPLVVGDKTVSWWAETYWRD